MANRRSYAICSNPRSGSTFLAYLLISTKMLGAPSEWLRSDGAPARPDIMNYPGDLQSQITYMLNEGATPNGIVGVKMFPEHFDGCTEPAWAEQMPDLHFLYLTREDLLGQAISLAIARQTHSYTHLAPEATNPVFDADQIDRCLHFIAVGEARWRCFFAINGIEPLRLTYDRLVAEPEACVAVICDWMHVERQPVDWSAIPVKRQAGDRNREWRERYLSSRRSLAVLPRLLAVPNERTLSDLQQS